MGADTFPAHLIREDLQDFAGYSSARTSAPDEVTAPATVWLNANESGSPNVADANGSCRRYPAPQPSALVEAFADLWATTPERVVVGRGSDEAIELLVRTLCRPGGDGIVVTTPTFGMYAVSARLHGVPVIDVPQLDEEVSWRVDTAAVARAAREHGARIVFLASPGNPTGSVVPLREVAALVDELSEQAVVVIDEAYGEFAAQRSAVTLLEEHPTLVVLRTLSKAHALAGARVGIALAHPDLASHLRRVQAPYPLPEPVTRLALEALGGSALKATHEHVGQVLRLRDQVGRWLRDVDQVRALYTSEANFFLVRCEDPDTLLQTLLQAGIVVRDMRHLPGLHDALRVTIGTGQEMDGLRRAIDGVTDPAQTSALDTDDPISPLVKESPA